MFFVKQRLGHQALCICIMYVVETRAEIMALKQRAEIMVID